LKPQPCARASWTVRAWQLDVNVAPYDVLPGFIESGAREGAACMVAFAARRPRPGQMVAASAAGKR